MAKYSNITSTKEMVGPAKAKEYLSRNTNNRIPSQSWVRTLARMMEADEWKLTHQGIAFNCDGSLKDGQHRLLAIILSGKTVPLMVSRGLTDEDADMIDIHKRRTDTDVLKRKGFETNHHLVAIAKRMMLGVRRSWGYEVTRPEVMRFYIRHEAAILFAHGERGRQRATSNAGVWAPVARAWYEHDHDRLRRFQEVVHTGVMADPDEEAAVTLRNWLISGKRDNGQDGRRIVYCKTESALIAFLEGRKLSKLYESSGELFPLREEEDE
jgi:hypothetical protein